MLANKRRWAGLAPARSIFRSLTHKDERGVTLVEYALLLALIAVLSVGSLVLLGNTVNNTLTNTAIQVASNGGSAPAVKIALSQPTTDPLDAGNTEPFIATIEDASGIAVTSGPFAGTSVTFSQTAASTGSVDNLGPITAQAGVASDIVEGDQAGPVFLEATATLSNGAVTSNVVKLTIDPGTGTSLLFNQAPAKATDGVTFTTTPIVEVLDSKNNLDTSFSGSITLGVTPTGAGGATLSPTCANQVAVVGGKASFPGCALIGPAATTYYLTATSGALNTQSPITLIAGAPATLAFQTYPTSATAGNDFTTNPVVQIEDNEGNIVTTDSNSQITLAIDPTGTTGTGSLQCQTSTVQAVNGLATFNSCELSSGGTYVLEASDSTESAANAITAPPIVVGQAPAFTSGDQFPFPAYSTGSTTFSTGSTSQTYQFTASGYPAPTFSSGNLPNNLGLSNTGLLSDNGLANGTYHFTVTASNSAGSANQAFAVTVAAAHAPGFCPPAGAIFTADSSTDTAQICGTGSPSPSFSASAVGGSQTWPIPGISLSSTGLLSDTGTDPPGNYLFTVTATNGAGTPATETYDLYIQQQLAPFFLNNNTTTFYAGNNTDTFDFFAYGQPDSITFSATSLPTGIALSSGGVLTDTGTDAIGTYHFTVTASNGVSPAATQNFTLKVVGIAPSFTSGDPQDGYTTGSTTFPPTGSASYTFTAAGDPTAITFTAPGLPAWASLNAGVLTVSGSQVVGDTTFTVTASNGVTPDATQTFTLQVGIAPNFTTPPGNNGAATFTADSSSDTYNFVASGDPQPTFSAFAANGGQTWPIGGIALNTSTGALTDTGTDLPGTYTFTVRASNGITPSDTVTFTLTVKGTAPKFTTPSTATGSATFIADSSTDSYTFIATGNPPPTFTAFAANGGQTWPIPGIALNANTGALTDTGTDLPGTYTFTVRASNNVTPSATVTFTLTITGTAPKFTTPTGATGSATFTEYSTADSYAFVATGNPSPTFTASAVGLGQTWPIPGVQLSNAGVLTDTGTDAPGTYKFTVTAANGVTPNATVTFTLNIPAVSLAPTFTNPNGGSGTATYTFLSNNNYYFTAIGYPAPTFSGTADGGLITVTSTGQLKYTGTYPFLASQDKTYTFNVTASNGISPNATVSFTLHINS